MSANAGVADTELEQDALRRRIAAAMESLAAAQTAWDARDAAAQSRIDEALERYRVTGTRADLKALNVARADRRAMEARPVEPMSVGMLKGRLELLESRR